MSHALPCFGILPWTPRTLIMNMYNSCLKICNVMLFCVSEMLHSLRLAPGSDFPSLIVCIALNIIATRNGYIVVHVIAY